MARLYFALTLVIAFVAPLEASEADDIAELKFQHDLVAMIVVAADDCGIALPSIDKVIAANLDEAHAFHLSATALLVRQISSLQSDWNGLSKELRSAFCAEINRSAAVKKLSGD